MKTILWLAICLHTSIAVFAQEPESRYKVYDFSQVDPARVDKKVLAKKLDSIYMASGYDSLSQLIGFVSQQEYNVRYASFFIGYQSSQASLGHLKSGLRSLGFADLSESFSGVPWGVEVRGKKLVFNYCFTPGIKNKASNNDYTVEVRGLNVQFGVGYDLLPWKRLHFYPMAAISMQDFDIDVKRKAASTDVTQVDELILNPAGTSLSRRSWDVTYGADLSYHLLYSPSGGGIILGLRYGWVSPLSKGKFKINDSTAAYQSDDSINESFFSVVLKFYMKTGN